MHNPVLIQWEEPTVLTTSYVSVVKIVCFMLPIRSRPAHRIDNDIYNHNAAASGTREVGSNRV